MLVILHNIRSTYNVGSIFRTADGAGCEKIYLCGITPAPLDRFGEPQPQLTKVSLGAEKSVPWEKCGSTARLIDKLKKDGLTILAVEQHGKAIPYYKIHLSRHELKKTALVVGHEIKGLSDAVLHRADKILEIPMRGRKESLNVAVAFGIVAFHFLEHLQKLKNIV